MPSGSSKAPKQKETALEREQGQQGIAKWNRYIDNYDPMERQAATEAQRVGIENTLAGKTNADVMQEAQQASTQALSQGANVNQSLSALGQLTRATSSTLASTRASAVSGNNKFMAGRQLDAISTGLGQQATNTGTLAQLTSQAGATARQKLQNKQMVNQSRSAMQAQIVGSAVQAGGHADLKRRREAQTRQLRYGGVYNNVDGE